jgi:hypothetical protein
MSKQSHTFDSTIDSINTLSNEQLAGVYLAITNNIHVYAYLGIIHRASLLKQTPNNTEDEINALSSLQVLHAFKDTLQSMSDNMRKRLLHHMASNDIDDDTEVSVKADVIDNNQCDNKQEGKC